MILRNFSMNEWMLKGVDKLEENGHYFLAGVVIGIMDFFSVYGAIIYSLTVGAAIIKSITKKKEE